METRLVSNPRQRRLYENKLSRLSEELGTCANDLKALMGDMQRGELSVGARGGTSSSGQDGEMTGEEAGDMMWNDMNDIQDKTKASLQNTKNMVAASKQVGDATMEELLRQREQIRTIDEEAMRIEDNSSRADRFEERLMKKSSPMSIQQQMTPGTSGTALTGSQQVQLQQIRDRDAEFDTELDEIGEGIQDLHELALRQGEEVQRQNAMMSLSVPVPSAELEASKMSKRLAKTNYKATRSSAARAAKASSSVPSSPYKKGFSSDEGLSSTPSSGKVVDFTLIPHTLDAAIEKNGEGNALRSTTVKTDDCWVRNRQENLLTGLKKQSLSSEEIKKEKNKAFDLLDALSRSGSLPIAYSELHVVIAVTHCFDKDVMSTVICDNVNPIEKLECSTLLLASAVHGVPARELIADSNELQRLEVALPLLLESSENIETMEESEA